MSWEARGMDLHGKFHHQHPMSLCHTFKHPFRFSSAKDLAQIQVELYGNREPSGKATNVPLLSAKFYQWIILSSHCKRWSTSMFTVMVSWWQGWKKAGRRWNGEGREARWKRKGRHQCRQVSWPNAIPHLLTLLLSLFGLVPAKEMVQVQGDPTSNWEAYG